jgi:hypothetical protein
MPAAEVRVHKARPAPGDDTHRVDAEWAALVRAALLDEDGRALAQLFGEALSVEGRSAATRSWLDAISGYDAEAQTG